MATGDDEKHLRALGKLPPKEPSRAEAFVNWCASSLRRLSGHHLNRPPGVLLTHCSGNVHACNSTVASSKEARNDVLGTLYHC